MPPASRWSKPDSAWEDRKLPCNLRDVGTRVVRNLPGCDCFTMVDGVTNDGNVNLSVPKSVYVDRGCPDQGQWLLNMKTDSITRLSNAHASLKTQPH
jgi:hypothetical protein